MISLVLFIGAALFNLCECGGDPAPTPKPTPPPTFENTNCDDFKRGYCHLNADNDQFRKQWYFDKYQPDNTHRNEGECKKWCASAAKKAGSGCCQFGLNRNEGKDSDRECLYAPGRTSDPDPSDVANSNKILLCQAYNGDTPGVDLALAFACVSGRTAEGVGDITLVNSIDDCKRRFVGTGKSFKYFDDTKHCQATNMQKMELKWHRQLCTARNAGNAGKADTITYETEATNVICSGGEWLRGKATSTEEGCKSECSSRSACDTFCWSNKSPHWDCLMYKSCATKISKFNDGKSTSGYKCYKKQQVASEETMGLTMVDAPGAARDTHSVVVLGLAVLGFGFTSYGAIQYWFKTA